MKGVDKMTNEIMKIILDKLVSISENTALREQDIFDIVDDYCQATPDDVRDITEELSDRGITVKGSILDGNLIMKELPNEEKSVKLYLQEIDKIPLLTPDEERVTAKMAAEGDINAKKRLIESNLRLVASIAKKYVGCGLDFLDLIEEGNIGLLKAVERFDYAKGFRFSSYATWWIRQAVSRGIADQGRTIRVPVYMAEDFNRVRKARNKLIRLNYAEPTADEIAKELNKPVEKIKEILQNMEDPISLENPIGDDEDSSFGDVIADENAPSPDDEAINMIICDDIHVLLDSLTPRESQVLRMRYGIGYKRQYTSEEISRVLNVTREQILQIEVEGLLKFRHPSRIKYFQDYQDDGKEKKEQQKGEEKEPKEEPRDE